MDEGQIEIDSIEQIDLHDITAELARASGFKGLVDLLKVAKHGQGENVYLVRFHYVEGGCATIGRPAVVSRKRASTKKTSIPRTVSGGGDKQRKHVAKILESMPEGEANPVGPHLSLEVRKKRFGWFMVDHHGDGRVAINCKASADMHDVLSKLAPDHFHIPKYVGNKGWIGLWLDVPKVDWATVELALREGYKLVAAKSLRAQLDQ